MPNAPYRKVIKVSSPYETYEGESIDNIPDGIGILTHANGTIYKGEFKNGIKHGKGIMNEVNGTVYNGEFNNGLYNGKGTIHYVGNITYTGDFINGYPEGIGIMNSKGYIYKGEFKKGLRHGRGILTYPDGLQEYDGEWSHNEFYGNGVMTINYDEYKGKWMYNLPVETFEVVGLGYKYSGEIKKVTENIYVKEGNGKLINEKGTYEGKFKNDDFLGYHYKDMNGNTYVGYNFKNNEIFGNGYIHFASGDLYSGRLNNSIFNGFGAYSKPDDVVRYTGIWINGEPDHNSDFKIISDKDTYIGKIKKINDKYVKDGYGTLSNKNGVIIHKGLFKNDVFMDSKGLKDLTGLKYHKRYKKRNATSVATKWMNLCKKHTSSKEMSDDEFNELINYVGSRETGSREPRETRETGEPREPRETRETGEPREPRETKKDIRKICAVLSADLSINKLCNDIDDEREYDEEDKKDDVINLKKSIGINGSLKDFCIKNNIKCNNTTDLIDRKISTYKSEQIFKDKHDNCYSYSDLISNNEINPYTREPFTPEEKISIKSFLDSFTKKDIIYQTLHTDYPVQLDQLDQDTQKLKKHEIDIDNIGSVINFQTFIFFTNHELLEMIDDINYEYEGLHLTRPTFENTDDQVIVLNKFFDALSMPNPNSNLTNNIFYISDLLRTQKYIDIIERHNKTFKRLNEVKKRYGERLKLQKEYSINKGIKPSKFQYIAGKYSTMPEIEDLKNNIILIKNKVLYIKNPTQNGLIKLEKLVNDILKGDYDHKDNLCNMMYKHSDVLLHLIGKDDADDASFPETLKNLSAYFSFFRDFINDCPMTTDKSVGKKTICGNARLFTKLLNNSDNELCLNAKFEFIFGKLVTEEDLTKYNVELINIISKFYDENCQKIKESNKNNIDDITNIILKSNLENINSLIHKIYKTNKIDVVKKHLKEFIENSIGIC